MPFGFKRQVFTQHYSFALRGYCSGGCQAGRHPCSSAARGDSLDELGPPRGEERSSLVPAVNRCCRPGASRGQPMPGVSLWHGGNLPLFPVGKAGFEVSTKWNKGTFSMCVACHTSGYDAYPQLPSHRVRGESEHPCLLHFGWAQLAHAEPRCCPCTH